jgi:chorismate dehydratase
MPLRIGRIAYLNVAPYFHYLASCGFDGEIVSGVPAELNAMLADGFIDACPSSSFEYGQNPEKYFLLPGHSISSIGPVHSVLLFAPGPVSSLAGNKIAITGESATSINLLKILLAEFSGIDNVTFAVPDNSVEECLSSGQPALLIGDRALAAAVNCPRGFQTIDLGALWYHFTGMPFVFALWILRKEAVELQPTQIQELATQLQLSRQKAFENLDEMASQLSVTGTFPKEELLSYWQGMSYDLTEGHLEGLRLYFTLCQKHGLLDDVPEFKFFPEV